MYDVCKGASRITGRVEEREQGEKIIAYVLLWSLVVGIFRGQNLGFRFVAFGGRFAMSCYLTGRESCSYDKKTSFFSLFQFICVSKWTQQQLFC
jgi:hypothetical protein